MVNFNSPTFKFFERVGFLVGRLIRVIFIATLIGILTGKVAKSKPGQQQQAPQTQPEP